MWSLVLELAKRHLASLLRWAILAGGILSVIFGLRNAGKQAAKLESMKQTLKSVKVKNDIEASVDGASAAERRRLRDKWTR